METKSREILENPSDIYTEAVKLARNNDLLGWHQLEERVRSPIYDALLKWQENYKQTPLDDSEKRRKALDEAIKCVAPLFVVALVGIQSEIEKLKNQKLVLDYVLNIPGWNYAGAVQYGHLPSALGYVYQGLHGAISVYSKQLDLAMEFVDMKVTDHLKQKPLRVWQRHEIMARPESFMTNSKEAWKYLSESAQRWRWLREFFKRESHYRTSLVAYYLALHIRELACLIADGQEDIIQGPSGYIFHIPLHFLLEDQDIVNQALPMLHRDGKSVENLWDQLGVTREAMEANWQDWFRHIESWLSKIDYVPRLTCRLPHKELFKFL